MTCDCLWWVELRRNNREETGSRVPSMESHAWWWQTTALSLQLRTSWCFWWTSELRQLSKWWDRRRDRTTWAALFSSGLLLSLSVQKTDRWPGVMSYTTFPWRKTTDSTYLQTAWSRKQTTHAVDWFQNGHQKQGFLWNMRKVKEKNLLWRTGLANGFSVLQRPLPVFHLKHCPHFSIHLISCNPLISIFSPLGI